MAEFLNELSPIDAIVELVQNELDAGSRRTEIEIGNDALICSGRGEVIDDKGWERLRYILGAGALVEAKVDGIGSKNHGIRACFLLGDQITVQSDGQRIDLTVRGDPEKPDRFFPAAWDREPDVSAPRKGVRVVVPYRRHLIRLPDRNPLVPPSVAYLDALFDEALLSAPERFLCASPPGKPWRYELILRRGDRVVRLKFAATPTDQNGLSSRTCHLAETSPRGRLVTRRICRPFEFKPSEGDSAKVAKLFKDRARIIGELCWSADSKGRPMPSAGTYRYPIAFPIQEAGNPFAFDVSGPFVVGRVRHSLAKDRRNEDLLATAKRAFVDIMRETLVPLFGPDALNLICSTDRTEPGLVAALAGNLLASGALPIVKSAARRNRGQRAFLTSDPNQPLLLPSPSYRDGALDRNLTELAPSTVQLLHPSSPGRATAALRAWADTHGGIQEFSEMDAARAVFVEEAPPDGGRARGWVERSASVLRMLELSRLHGTIESGALADLKNVGRLPVDDGTAHPWKEVRRSKMQSLHVPGVEAPLLLHRKLKDYSVLRKGAGEVTQFKLDKFLSDLDFDEVDDGSRLAFFRWLRRGHSLLLPRTLAKIASYPIWPDVNGSCRPLSTYCHPASAYLRDALGTVLPKPSDEILRFPGLRKSSNGALRLRTTPEAGELRTWHEEATSRVAALADTDSAKALALIDEIEETLDRMRRDGFHPRHFAVSHLSATRSGKVRPISDLHVETAAVTACALLDDDLFATKRKTLHIALGANQSPLPQALVRALRTNPVRRHIGARLAAYKEAGQALFELADEPIIAEGEEVLRPSDLAFALPVDHWGEWKRRVPLGGFSPEETKLFEEAGVLRGLKEESSRDFFEWLAGQPQLVD